MRQLFAAAILGALASACTTVGTSSTGNEIILLGESNATGEAATAQANLALRNAQAAGCHGISVGGYAAGGIEAGGIVYGIPLMVRCPAGVRLLPNGAPAP
jgi:hypothetical protein